MTHNYRAARAAAEIMAKEIKARGPVDPPAADLARVAGLLAAHPWIFAKTMADNPHEYTLRRQWPCDEDFAFVVQFIQSYGYVERYPDPVRGWPYIMLNVAGFKCWPFGNRVESVILINRKPLSPVEA